MYNYFSNETLLSVPSKRAAYSDRTSYLMAEMSRLAYFKFEGGNTVDEIISQVRELLPESQKLAALEALIKSHVKQSSKADSEAILTQILEQSGFTFVRAFDDSGTDTQAFLCINSSQGIAILAFRGTEPSLKDIKSDINARLETVQHNEKPVQIHSGYLAGFNSIRDEIKEALDGEEVKGLQLFITGHSLGGALAITAVKFLASDITGACYTFGSPPVGTKTFDHDIRTPIYRVVNHVDIVPRLPNPVLVLGIRFIGMLAGLILPLAGAISMIKETALYSKLEMILIDAQKYRQSGYGSYLVGEGSSVRLRYSVSIIDKIHWWLKQFANVFQGEFKLLSDHSIDMYSKKLAIWAESRK